MGYAALWTCLLRGRAWSTWASAGGLQSPAACGWHSLATKWLKKDGVLRGNLQQPSFSTPCGRKYMRSQIEVLQGRRAVVGLPSCSGVMPTCIHQLVDQTRFHKLSGLLNHGKGLCLRRKRRLRWNTPKINAQEGTGSCPQGRPREAGREWRQMCPDASSWAGELMRT